MMSLRILTVFTFLSALWLTPHAQISVSPNSGCAGSSFNITITNPANFLVSSCTSGGGLTPQGSSSVSVPASNFSPVVNGTSVVTATLTIPQNTPTSSYGFVFTRCNTTYSCSNCFTVLGPPSPVAISPVDPASACPGVDVNLTCNATGASGYQWTLNGNDIQQATNSTYAANAPGVYACNASNTCGTTSSNNSTVAYFSVSLPTISVSQNTLTANAPGAVSFQWLLNGVEIPNATSSSYNQTQPGSYAVSVVDGNGCISTSEAVVISGLNDIAGNVLELIPNPAKSILQIITDASAGFNIQLYNQSGQLVQESKSNTSTLMMDVAKLPEGIYIVKLSTDKGLTVRKLVVE